MIKNLHIFYFTGTGNALAASIWIAELFSKNNIDFKITEITPSLKISKKEIGKNTLIGFCYPTHGFNAPPVVIDFLLRLPKENNPIFLLNTRGGLKISKFFTPGLGGLALYLPALILKTKGFKIVGLQPMDLPSNWISLHPGLKRKVVDSIFLRCETITKNFAQKILSGKKVHKGLHSLPFDLLVSPISIVYYFFGRFALAKTYIAGDQCDGCQICKKQCPVQAIQMRNNRPFWTRKCESCMHCLNVCPKQTIQTPHLFVAFIWWFVFIILPAFLLSVLIPYGSFMDIHRKLISWLFIFITGIPFIFFSYEVLHFLLRFHFFNRLITFTSLTHFPFWRRYFAPKKYIKPKI